MVGDYYTRLGAAADATHVQLRAAYRQRARELHPDGLIGASKTDAAKSDMEMRELNEAWAVLGDQAKRAAYDLSASLQILSAAEEGIRSDEGWVTQDIRPVTSLSTLAWRLLLGLFALGLAFVALSMILAQVTEESNVELALELSDEAAVTSEDCVIVTVTDLILPVDCSEPNLGRPVEIVDQDHVCSNNKTLRINIPDGSGRWLCVLPLE